MRSSIKEVWALQFPCHEVLNICSNSSPVSKLTHLHPTHFFPTSSSQSSGYALPSVLFLKEGCGLYLLLPLFMRKMERTFIALLWAISRSGLEKLTFISLWGKKRRFLLLFKVRKKTDTQAFDRDCCLTHQKRLLLSDCTWNPMMIFRNLPIFWGPVEHYPHSYNWVPAGTNPTPRNPKYLSYW